MEDAYHYGKSQRLVPEMGSPTPQTQPNPRKFYCHFLFKAVLVTVVLVILPLFPSEAPEFISHSVVTRNWELFHLLFVGIAVSYGLFCRRNVETEKENQPKICSSDNYVSRIFQVSPVFDDDVDNPSGSDDQIKIQTWNSRYFRGEPMAAVKQESSVPDELSSTITRISNTPLHLPVRSLRSRVSDSEDLEFNKEPSVCSGSLSRSSSGSSSSNGSIRSRNGEVRDVDPLDLGERLQENVVLPSPIPWRSRSGRMEMKEEPEVDAPLPYSIPHSAYEAEIGREMPQLHSQSFQLPMSWSSSDVVTPSPYSLPASANEAGIERERLHFQPFQLPMSWPTPEVVTAPYRPTANVTGLEREGLHSQSFQMPMSWPTLEVVTPPYHPTANETGVEREGLHSQSFRMPMSWPTLEVVTPPYLPTANETGVERERLHSQSFRMSMSWPTPEIATPSPYSLPPSADEAEIAKERLHFHSSPSPKKLSPSPSLSPELQAKNMEDSARKKDNCKSSDMEDSSRKKSNCTSSNMENSARKKSNCASSNMEDSARKKSNCSSSNMENSAKKKSNCISLNMEDLTRKKGNYMSSNVEDSEMKKGNCTSSSPPAQPTPPSNSHKSLLITSNAGPLSNGFASQNMGPKNSFKDESKDSRSSKRGLRRRSDPGLDTLRSEVKSGAHNEGISMAKSVRTFRKKEPVVEGRKNREYNGEQVEEETGKREVEAMFIETTGRKGGDFKQVPNNNEKPGQESSQQIPTSPLSKHPTEEKNEFLDKVTVETDKESDGEADANADDIQGSLEKEELPSNSVADAGVDGEVDKKADEFIAKFREQIRLQRIDSIKRSKGKVRARTSSQ